MRFLTFFAFLCFWFVAEYTLYHLWDSVFFDAAPSTLFSIRISLIATTLVVLFGVIRPKAFSFYQKIFPISIFSWKKGLIFLVIYLILLGIVSILHRYEYLKTPEFILNLQANLPNFWLSFFALVIFGVLFEEILFRGWLFAILEMQSNKNPHQTVIFSSLIFSILHLQYDILIVMIVFIFGILLGYARWYSQSLVLPILLHALHNFLTLLAMYQFF